MAWPKGCGILLRPGAVTCRLWRMDKREKDYGLQHLESCWRF